MNVDKKQDRSEADAELEREIREQRKFTLEEAIGRLAGPGGLKGESPITRLRQTEFELQSYLRSHLTDAGCVIEVIILRHVIGSEVLIHNLGQPLLVLAAYCQKVLASDHLLKEFVREADVEWGKIMLERPYFEREGSPAHPDDPYTIDSARRMLTALLQQLTVEPLVASQGDT